jgi:hypothetical protein
MSVSTPKLSRPPPTIKPTSSEKATRQQTSQKRSWPRTEISSEIVIIPSRIHSHPWPSSWPSTSANAKSPSTEEPSPRFHEPSRNNHLGQYNSCMRRLRRPRPYVLYDKRTKTVLCPKQDQPEVQARANAWLQDFRARAKQRRADKSRSTKAFVSQILAQLQQGKSEINFNKHEHIVLINTIVLASSSNLPPLPIQIYPSLLPHIKLQLGAANTDFQPAIPAIVDSGSCLCTEIPTTSWHLKIYIRGCCVKSVPAYNLRIGQIRHFGKHFYYWAALRNTTWIDDGCVERTRLRYVTCAYL